MADLSSIAAAATGVLAVVSETCGVLLALKDVKGSRAEHHNPTLTDPLTPPAPRRPVRPAKQRTSYDTH